MTDQTPADSAGKPHTSDGSDGASQIRRTRLGGSHATPAPDAPTSGDVEQVQQVDDSPQQESTAPTSPPPSPPGPVPPRSMPHQQARYGSPPGDRRDPRRNHPRTGGPRPSGFRPDSDRPQPRPAFKPLDVLYEDKQIIAVHKPAHLPVVGRDDEPSVLEAVRRQLNIRRMDRGPWTLHQIEESATGVVVLARTPAARDVLLQSRRFERYYLALVGGAPADPSSPDNGTINSDQQGRDTSEVRNLVTHYQRLGYQSGAALLKMRPRTDARGQLDKHLRQLNARPVQDKPIDAAGLHLHEVTLTHPTTSARMRIQSPPPAWMYERVGLEPPKGARQQNAAPNKSKGWDDVAGWYAELLTSSRNDLQTELVWPGVLRLLEPLDGVRILDVACGEGSFDRQLASRGASVTGIDASERLIDLARKLSNPDDPDARFVIGDACNLGSMNLGEFDAACSILALMNIDEIQAVLRAIHEALIPGGRFVAVVLHPAFRSPRRTSWGWDGPDAQTQRQYRRVDEYMTEAAIPIVMNPGAVAKGEDPITTTTYVRPLQKYVEAFTSAGLLIDAIEEWTSPRQSEPGPRAAEENRARGEFPMFMTIRAIKLKGSAPE